MASLMTGVDPAEFLDESGKPWGLPESAQTLAEHLSDAGYESWAFIANPTLHESNGFAQGFTHFETAPYDLASLSLHADHLDERMRPHLGRLKSPFFLYAHFLDPHDPYDNPDIEDGRSPFFPEYRGTLKGSDIHGLYLRKLKMKDPEQDVAHLGALYDSEIQYVDRYVGTLLDALGPETLAQTLVVLTSDHGEELFDHGGWKHGESVYEEQVRVPLIFRWDGRLAPGRRLGSTVRLLDVMPTVLEAAGIPIPDDLQGRSLLPALQGEPLAPEPAFSRHHADGPVRIARIDGRRKTILFDREASLEPESERITTFLELDRRRMQRLESYDLRADPREQSPLEDPGEGEGVFVGLDPYLEGLRVFVSGMSEGHVHGRLELERSPEAVHPWFLGPDDRIELKGKAVEFFWTGDGVHKGMTLDGPIGAIVGLHVEPEGAFRVQWGSGGRARFSHGTAPSLDGRDAPVRGSGFADLDSGAAG